MDGSQLVGHLNGHDRGRLTSTTSLMNEILHAIRAQNALFETVKESFADFSDIEDVCQSEDPLEMRLAPHFPLDQARSVFVGSFRQDLSEPAQEPVSMGSSLLRQEPLFMIGVRPSAVSFERANMPCDFPRPIEEDDLLGCGSQREPRTMRIGVWDRISIAVVAHLEKGVGRHGLRVRDVDGDRRKWDQDTLLGFLEHVDGTTMGFCMKALVGRFGQPFIEVTLFALEVRGSRSTWKETRSHIPNRRFDDPLVPRAARRTGTGLEQEMPRELQ